MMFNELQRRLHDWLPNGPKCQLHQVRLRMGKTRIVYGLIAESEKRLEACKSLFPNANSVTLGGCEVCTNSPRTQLRQYCKSCRAAEREWNEQNPNVRW